MRTILLIIQKEFRQVFRNRMMLPIIFVVPVVQLLILAFAATFDIKNIKLYVVDKDLSSTSKLLVSKFDGSPFFKVVNKSFSLAEAENNLKSDKTDVILHINNGFERQLVRENRSSVQLIFNSINGTVAGIAQAYSGSIIAQTNNEIRADWFSMSGQNNALRQIKVTYSFWYNPLMNYKIYMVPGILVILVTIIGMFLSGLNLVREKEMGTIEQINVTPIKKYQFIIGKLLPFWIIAIFDLALGLTIGKLLFSIPFEGSFFTLLLMVSVYLFVILGIGLFISTLVYTQQQTLFIAFFFMLIFLLMSGIFTPVESMPDWAQWFNKINPMVYFMRTIRMILLKGSALKDVFQEFISLSVYAVIILSLAVWRYRKTA